MAKRNLKMTGFARFIIFLLFAAPITFFAASYIKGEDGVENIKRLIGLSETEAVRTDVPAPIPSAEPVVTPSETAAEDEVMINSQIKKLQDELKDKDERINQLYLDNEQFKKDLADKEAELQNVRQQLDQIRAAFDQ